MIDDSMQLHSVEKTHLVWGAISNRSRMASPIYLLCLASMTGYLVLFVLIIIGAYSFPIHLRNSYSAFQFNRVL
jgi:hypothetical protein